MDAEVRVSPESHSCQPTTWLGGYRSPSAELSSHPGPLLFLRSRVKAPLPGGPKLRQAWGPDGASSGLGRGKTDGDFGQEGLLSESELATCLPNGFYQLGGTSEVVGGRGRV